MNQSENFITLNASTAPILSNSSNVCDKSETWWHHQHNAYVFAYKVVTPIYFVFGTVGHLFCLVAFQRQAKKETPYAYQIFVTVSETMEIFAFTCYSLSFRWFSGIVNEGALWYQRSYLLMCYAARVSFPALNAFITTTLLLSVSMAADRVFAMAKPYAYKNANAKKHQTVAVCLCVCIGFATSIFDAFRFHVILIDKSDGYSRYAARGDPEYMRTFLATFLAHLRDSVRVLGLLTLVTCNALIARLYRRRAKKAKSLTIAEDAKRRTERQAENTLLLLTISQSVLKSIGMTFLITFYVVVYVEPNFLACGSLFVAPCLDATLQLVSVADFYLVLCVSKQFRRMISDVIKRDHVEPHSETATSRRAPTATVHQETRERMTSRLQRT